MESDSMSPIRQAVILAGGEGIKLRPLTFSRPKPLLPMVNKPILDYAIFQLINAGITHILITVDYLGDQIRDYIAQNSFGIAIEVHQIETYSGSAQALLELKDQLDEAFIVVLGDCLYDLALSDAIDFFMRQNADLGLIVRKETDVLGKGGLLVDQHQIQAILDLDDPSAQQVSDAWIYYVNRRILDEIPSDRPMDIHLDLVRLLIEKQRPIYAWEMTSFWAVIGRIHPYIAANFWVLQNIATAYVGARSQVDPSAILIPPYFIEEDCVIGADTQVGPNAIICRESVLAQGVRLHNTVIHSNVHIGRDSQLGYAVVADHTTVGTDCRCGAFSIIASDCVLGDHTTIADGARVGPGVTTLPHTNIDDFLFPNSAHNTQVQDISGLDLTEAEKAICQRLQEAGEQPKSALESLGIGEAQLTASLDRLIHHHLIASYGEAPLIYFLTQSW